MLNRSRNNLNNSTNNLNDSKDNLNYALIETLIFSSDSENNLISYLN